MIICKEIYTVDGNYTGLGMVRLSDSSNMAYTLGLLGKMEISQSVYSYLTRLFIKFYKPSYVIELENYAIFDMVNSSIDNEDILGDWPFDRIGVLDFPSDMEELRQNYGIAGLRLIAFNE